MTDETIRMRGETYIVTQCGACGVWYTVPQFVYETQQRLGGYHFCPAGHQWGWDKGTEHKEREAIRLERDRLKQDAARLEDEVSQVTARAVAAEKQYMQARRRAVAGVCPCCNRTFSDVQRHMATKHKNVVPLAQKDVG